MGVGSAGMGFVPCRKLGAWKPLGGGSEGFAHSSMEALYSLFGVVFLFCGGVTAQGCNWHQRRCTITGTTGAFPHLLYLTLSSLANPTL